MKEYLNHDEWRIVENQFHHEYNKISESIFSLGNGSIGQRANFEEAYSGESMQGSYIAGVYYPDKTKVGWWKIGYPEYFAKVLNSPNWIGIEFSIDGEPFDLNHCNIGSFERILDMKQAYLERNFIATMRSGKSIKVSARRFLSMAEPDIAAINYSITPLNFSGEIKIQSYIDGDIKNKDTNWEEKFWDEVSQSTENQICKIKVQTKKTNFKVCVATHTSFSKDFGEIVNCNYTSVIKTKFAGTESNIIVKQNECIVINKYACILSSLNFDETQIEDYCLKKLKSAVEKGFAELFRAHTEEWQRKWENSDIIIEGDVAAQQGIRFNIFQLNQTYTGKDSRLNIGPKGFTGEKYGGSTYWDTEAYCLPFYLSTADPKVARNLLIYRYNHLGKAIENAEKLGFKDGAALYPMVTMNGEECHNEWEITFEEIHRNGAIAYAIYNYINYNNDKAYLAEYGLEVLIGISRFWEQRVNYSQEKNKYVMLGVTGPNEYENNINNNWYTNYIAKWCMTYTIESLLFVKEKYPEKFNQIIAKTKFDIVQEPIQWKDISDNMYFPEHHDLGIYLQQDGYMDKEQIMVKDLSPENLPLNQNWSWDRILRSCFIKQADVLQGLYFFEPHFDLETIRRNFDFYEPRTVHESSLSSCVHSVLASKIGLREKAYNLYLRSSRLDLDDYNNDTEDGLHITSMAGTWISVVQGFGGMRMKEGKLSFQPYLPEKWKSLSFEILFRGILIKLSVNHNEIMIENQSDMDLEIFVDESLHFISAKSKIEISQK